METKMRVIRWEGSDGGVYNSPGTYNALSDLPDGLAFGRNHPAPWVDFGLPMDKINQLLIKSNHPDEGVVFGFTSQSSEEEWFGPKARSALLAAGARRVVYEVPEHCVLDSNSNRQAVFVMSEAVLVEEYKL